MQERKIFTLIVDEGTQGCRKEFEDIKDVATVLTQLLDEQLIEITVKRKGIANSNPISGVTN